MAKTNAEVVSITRGELHRLRRDSAILDWIRKTERSRHPGRTPLPDLVAEMLETEGTINGILAAHVRRLDARTPAETSTDRAPAARTA